VPGWKVRGITRDPTSVAAKALAEKGIEVVQGNLDDPSSLPTAFESANAIYAVTDFWTPIFDGSSEGKVKPGQGILEWAYDLEVQQGKNIRCERKIKGQVDFSAPFRWQGSGYEVHL
jgi:hypothetical protein